MGILDFSSALPFLARVVNFSKAQFYRQDNMKYAMGYTIHPWHGQQSP